MHKETSLNVQQKCNNYPTKTLLARFHFHLHEEALRFNKYPTNTLKAKFHYQLHKKTLMFNKYPTNTLNAKLHYQLHQRNPKSTTNVQKISNNRAPPAPQTFKHFFKVYEMFAQDWAQKFKNTFKLSHNSLKKLLNFWDVGQKFKKSFKLFQKSLKNV